MRGGGFKPHMLRATEDPITRKVTDVVPVALPKIKLKDENDWSTVIAAMESVAQEQGGTAWMVGHGAPYRMAAKTGSAQVAGLRQDESRPVAQELLPLRLRDHALFIAFRSEEHTSELQSLMRISYAV